MNIRKYLPSFENIGMGISACFALLAGVLLVVLALHGCHPQTPPSDSGAPEPWRTGLQIGLLVVDGTDQALVATEQSVGLQGSALATYDGVLHAIHDADMAALNHLASGASACTLRSDMSLAADLFDRLAQVFNANNLTIPTSVTDFAGRFLGVIASGLPPCDTDAGSPVTASRIQTAFHLR